MVGVGGLAAGSLAFFGGNLGGDEELVDWPIIPADRSIDSEEERRGGGIGWGTGASESAEPTSPAIPIRRDCESQVKWTAEAMNCCC